MGCWEGGAVSDFTPGEWVAIKGAEEGELERCAVVLKDGARAYLLATIENGAHAALTGIVKSMSGTLSGEISLTEQFDAIDVLLDAARAALAKATPTTKEI